MYPPSFRNGHYTSRTDGGLELFCDSACVLLRRRLRFPIRCTKLLPTASTAPLGASNVGPCAAASWTLNNLIDVPFQTPTVPGVAPDAEPTTISAEKMNPHSSDSY